MSPQKEPISPKLLQINKAEKATSPSVNGAGKPPRPVGSLDRRRQLSTNREERDHKSRSAHSLKEKSSDSKEMKNKSKHMISRTGSFEVRHGGSGGGGSNSGESGPVGGPRSGDFNRSSPGFWEPPPPPAFPYYWDGYHFWPSSCHASREELRGVDYNHMQSHRRGTPGAVGPLPMAPHDHHHHPPPSPHHHQQQQQSQQRYGSNNTLNASQQDLSCAPYFGRYMGPPNPHPHAYCGCEGGRPYHPHQSTSSLWSQVGKSGFCFCVTFTKY